MTERSTEHATFVIERTYEAEPARKPAGSGTRLIVTEQGVFLDGEDKPEYREHRTKALLESLDAALRGEPAEV